MPYMILDCPRSYFETDGVIDQPKLDTFKEVAANAAAEYLNCNDYQGNPLNLLPDEIDVQVVPYDQEYVRFYGPVVHVRIIGSDYPDRMKGMGGIEDRLYAIQEALKAEIIGWGGKYAYLFMSDVDLEPIDVTFIPFPDGCYVWKEHQ